MPDTNIHDASGEGRAVETPAPASANASDYLKDVQSLRLRVRMTVYPAILMLMAVNYFVLGLTPFQTLVVGIAGLSIAILSTETAFVRGLQGRKRAAYPRAVLEGLGSISGVSEAGRRALDVINRLLGLRGSFLTLGKGDTSVGLVTVSGMSRDDAERLLQAGMASVGEAMRTQQPVAFSEADVRSPGIGLSRDERLLFIPVVALQSPIGAIGVVGHKGNKDLKDGQLLSAISVALGLSMENLRQKETILHLAYHDALTDLPNRTLFEDRLTVALAQARRRNQMLPVMFLDLDRFKQVNDMAGHATGDKLLRRVAERLTGLVREGDTVARVGGDEFTLLSPEVAGVEETVEIAERVLKVFQQPWALDGHEFHVTTSVGIAMYPNDGEDAESLLRNADTAMYRAKEQGRNNYQLYTPAMNARIAERLAVENSLRHGLVSGEFAVHYQPQVNIDTGQIVGAEALVRWQHPERGLVLPAEFIPVAEETGLIVPLGEWVLRTACAQNRAWQEAGLPPLRVAVNLSARQFQQRDLKSMVAQVLGETGLDPHCLQLEITEGVAMQDAEFTITMLRELRGMGIQIAIDDFGTGHSSLSYLRRLPIDVVKIDRSFVCDLTTDPNDAAIASTIVAMAHNLKLRVIAEGVETEEQLTFLKEQQCDEFQGYLFSKPVPAEKLEKIVVRGRRRSRARVSVDSS